MLAMIVKFVLALSALSAAQARTIPNDDASTSTAHATVHMRMQLPGAAAGAGLLDAVPLGHIFSRDLQQSAVRIRVIKGAPTETCTRAGTSVYYALLVATSKSLVSCSSFPLLAHRANGLPG